MNKWAAIALCLFVFMAASCASSKAALDYSMAEGIIWPGGQEKPRIKYSWSMYRVQGADSGSASSILFGESMPGGDPRDSDWLASPHGVYASEQGRLYVTDAGAGRVSVVDLKTMKSFNIMEAGDVKIMVPIAVAAAPDGRIYISDADMGRVGIYEPDGDFIHFIQGDLNRPTGIAIDAVRGVLYVCDTWEHVIYKYDLDGVRTGSIGARGEGEGEFNYPTHIAVGFDGMLYVADTLNFRVQFFTPDGQYAGSFGVPGDTYGAFDKIKGIAVDREGHIYITDSIQDMVMIYDRQGRLLLFFGRSGGFYGDFKHPAGIFVDGQDRIYVADSFNRRVQAFQFLGGD